MSAALARAALLFGAQDDDNRRPAPEVIDKLFGYSPGPDNFLVLGD